MLKLISLWFAIFVLAAVALLTASQYLITPIWLANVVAAVYAIKQRRYLKNYALIFLFTWSAILSASTIADHHQVFEQQIFLSGLSALQATLFVYIYYWLIKHLKTFTYRRTVLLILPNLFSTLIIGFLFALLPFLDGIRYLIFFDYVLEQIATGYALLCVLYAWREYKKIFSKDYILVLVSLVTQYIISINSLFHDCFILPLVNVYLTIRYRFKQFVFLLGLLSLVCSFLLVLPLSGQYWKEDEIHLFSHLSTYRVGIALFIVVFLYLSELQMRHRSLSKYLEKVSFYDELTHLKNRRFLTEKILRHPVMPLNQGAVLLIDIDNFKKINDQYGHAAGDKVLKEMAKILSIVFKNERAHLFRWGGEEFLILLQHFPNEEYLHELCAAVIASTQSSFIYDAQQVNFSVSMGVAQYANFTEANYNKIIDCADQMLYLAKDQGKCRYVIREDEYA